MWIVSKCLILCLKAWLKSHVSNQLKYFTPICVCGITIQTHCLKRKLKYYLLKKSRGREMECAKIANNNLIHFTFFFVKELKGWLANRLFFLRLCLCLSFALFGSLFQEHSRRSNVRDAINKRHDVSIISLATFAMLILLLPILNILL